MSKYCPSCGKQTLYETDDSDYDAGDKHACYSCGYITWMSESEPLEYTAEMGKVEEYHPLYSTMEMMFQRVAANFALQLLGPDRLVFEGKWKENAEAYKGNYGDISNRTLMYIRHTLPVA